MPLHRKGSQQDKTLDFKGDYNLVKENHSLSREWVTVFMQVSSALNIEWSSFLKIKRRESK